MITQPINQSLPGASWLRNNARTLLSTDFDDLTIESKERYRHQAAVSMVLSRFGYPGASEWKLGDPQKRLSLSEARRSN